MLLQVIQAGFKRSNLEMNSVSSILLGYLLPKVNFKSKVAIKLCKSEARFSKSNSSNENLFLVLLLAGLTKLHMGVETVEFLVEVLVGLLKSLEDNKQTSTFRCRLQCKVCWRTRRRAGRRCTGWPWSGGRGKEQGRGCSLPSRGGETFSQAAGGHRDPVLQPAGTDPGHQTHRGHVVH